MNPNMISDDSFLPGLCNILQQVETSEISQIEKAAEAVYSTMKTGGLLHVFSTGHSHMVADELFFRSGGLAPINPIIHEDFMPCAGAVNSTIMERKSGRAAEVLAGAGMHAGDSFLIASNSGINAAPVEAALYAKEKGLTVIGITSIEASRELPTRLVNGLKLFEVCDIVIDNHVSVGDGLLVVPSSGLRTGSVSSLACLFIAQRIVLKVVNLYLADGISPPVFCSANIQGGDELNKHLVDQYKDRIQALRNGNKAQL